MGGWPRLSMIFSDFSYYDFPAIFTFEFTWGHKILQLSGIVACLGVSCGE